MFKFRIKEFTTHHDRCGNEEEYYSQAAHYAFLCQNVESKKYNEIADTLKVSVEELQYRCLRIMSSILKAKLEETSTKRFEGCENADCLTLDLSKPAIKMSRL